MNIHTAHANKTNKQGRVYTSTSMIKTARMISQQLNSTIIKPERMITPR